MLILSIVFFKVRPPFKARKVQPTCYCFDFSCHLCRNSSRLSILVYFFTFPDLKNVNGSCGHSDSKLVFQFDVWDTVGFKLSEKSRAPLWQSAYTYMHACIAIRWHLDGGCHWELMGTCMHESWAWKQMGHGRDRGKTLRLRLTSSAEIGHAKIWRERKVIL